MDWLAIVKDFGFPAFVAIFVLCRLEPVVNRLTQTITTLTVVTAKANGMKSSEIEEIVRLVGQKSGKRRRITDKMTDAGKK